MRVVAAVADWKWTPFLALSGGSVLAVLLIVALVPDRIDVWAIASARAAASSAEPEDSRVPAQPGALAARRTRPLSRAALAKPAVQTRRGTAPTAPVETSPPAPVPLSPEPPVMPEPPPPPPAPPPQMVTSPVEAAPAIPAPEPPPGPEPSVREGRQEEERGQAEGSAGAAGNKQPEPSQGEPAPPTPG